MQLDALLLQNYPKKKTRRNLGAGLSTYKWENFENALKIIIHIWIKRFFSYYIIIITENVWNINNSAVDIRLFCVFCIYDVIVSRFWYWVKKNYKRNSKHIHAVHNLRRKSNRNTNKKNVIIFFISVCLSIFFSFIF